jgi:biopolymer transport protein ExbD
MGLKKKNKISAQFNMSALTDIIFLLLIFFMLTSTIIAPNALNLKLPGSTRTQTSSKKDLPDVAVRGNGTYEWNRKTVSKSQIESELRKLSRGKKSKKSFTISPDKKTPVENVVFVMDVAMRMKLNAVLLPEK